jgi:hypothetical protein
MAIALVLRVGGSFYDGLTPTIYANVTSLGTGSGASEANATTLTGALSGATAGDIIGVLPGVYTGTPGTGTLDVPIFKTTNSGTIGSPIIIVGKYDHRYYYANTSLRCEIRSSSPITPVNDANRPGIGLEDGQEYIQWRNFFLDMNYVPPSNSHGMSIFAYHTKGGRFRKCVYQMIAQANNSDNRNAIFAGGCGVSQIDYCYFFGGTTTGAGRGMNNTAITLYPGATAGNYPDITIEHNTIADAVTGIFIKGRSGTDSVQGSYGTVRYNLIRDMAHAAIGHQGEDTVAGMDYYQNLLVRCAGGGFIKENGLDNLVPELYQHARIYNNTIVDCGNTAHYGLGGYFLRHYPAAGVNFYEFYNNIIKYSTASLYALISADSNFGGTNHLNMDEVFASGQLDYNWYYRDGGSARFKERSGTYTGLAAWQTQLSGAGLEQNSTESAPPFVDAGADDYRLSSADTGGKTGGPRGCYITGNETIGNGVN